MLRKSAVLVVFVGFLTLGVTVFAMNKTDKGIKPGTVEGKIASVKGNVVTIKDSKGIERVVQVDSATGIKAGTPVWCEEDCGKALKIGSRIVNVQKVINAKQNSAWGDPHVNEKVANPSLPNAQAGDRAALDRQGVPLGSDQDNR